MRSIYKKIIINMFKILTSIYLKINKVEVIAITGSAGKTTVKTAISQLLSNKLTYVPKEAYNTEIGIPLSVFKLKSPENISSPLAWFGILFKMTFRLFRKSDFKRIVIEMGADHPGDIAYLVSFAKPHIAVVTTVLPVHTENFKDIQEIASEKGQLIRSLNEGDLAILNSDDELVAGMAKKTKAKIVWVGQQGEPDLSWKNQKISLDGMSFDIVWKGEKHPVNLQIIAPQLLTSLLSAIAVCLYLGEDLEGLLRKLEEYKSEAGRMNLVKGINSSTVLDDSYNANPYSVIAALDVLSKLRGRRIAVLGNMNELGGFEEEAHKMVGKRAGEVCDLLVTVGQKAKAYIASSAAQNLDEKKIHTFLDPYQAGKFLKKEIKKDDIILVKGSQNKVFVEETVKIIMLEPQKAETVLVRQSSFWQKKKKESFKNKE